jgi:hypothetical protein
MSQSVKRIINSYIELIIIVIARRSYRELWSLEKLPGYNFLNRENSLRQGFHFSGECLLGKEGNSLNSYFLFMYWQIF